VCKWRKTKNATSDGTPSSTLDRHPFIILFCQPTYKTVPTIAAAAARLVPVMLMLLMLLMVLLMVRLLQEARRS
jgi:hypothetical protein